MGHTDIRKRTWTDRSSDHPKQRDVPISRVGPEVTGSSHPNNLSPPCVWRHEAAAQSTDSLALLAVLWVNQCEQRGILVLISGNSDTRRQVREEVKVQYLLLFHLCSLSLLENLFQIRKANI